MKKTLIAGLALAAGLLGTSVGAADISFDTLHLAQGFNFRGSVPDAFGFITTLQLNAAAASPTTLKADIPASFPTIISSATGSAQVVGVLQSFKWSAGLTDPIALKFNVSTANRNVIFGLLQTPAKLTSTAVAFGLVIYCYDQATKQWYVALDSAKDLSITAVSLQASIAKEGKDKLLLSLPSNLANPTVKSPPNWDVQLSVMPAPKAQSITYQYAPHSSLVKTWGVAVVGQ